VCHSAGVSTSPNVSVATEERGDVVVISVGGEVDAHTAPAVREAVDDRIRPGARVVVDLSDVTFLDSTGLGVLVTSLKRLREVDGSLDLVVASPRVLKVFTLTGLDVVIPIHETVDAALA